MFKLSYFERLRETVTMMVRHPEYANKAQALVQCRHEVVDLKKVRETNPAPAKPRRS